MDILGYLESLTFHFERDGQSVYCVLIYAEPDSNVPGLYHPVVAEDTGFEGIACLDDTARAVLLALEVYEHTGSRSALGKARRWLSFVEYMQYSDGSFANFIRNPAGVRNATGPTSHRGGYWWSLRARWALARAYRLTGKADYRERYEACELEPIADGKLRAVQALAELELYLTAPSAQLRESILEHCDVIRGNENQPYFLDLPGTPYIHLWGYHQLHAVASASLRLNEPGLLDACRKTINYLVDPCVRERGWVSYPDREKRGMCAYCMSPLVQGLATMHRATGAKRYRRAALLASDWFYGRNDAGVRMYDREGGCFDGINDGVASQNRGAESAIEAGFAELERRSLESR